MSKFSKQNQNKPAPKPGAAPDPAASEAEYLAHQAADAKAAIARTLSQIGADLGHAVSPVGAIGSHPWLTLSATTVAGFVAAAAMVPSKKQQALRKLARIEKALHPERNRHIDQELYERDGNEPKRAKAGGRSLAVAIVDGLFKTLQPILLSSLNAAIARPSKEKMQADAAAKDQNGAGPG